MEKTYNRKKVEDKPVVAICYDFDKTLSPDDMQAQGYIQSVGYDVSEFWQKSNALAEENEMDQNLAYMYLMMKEAEGRIVFNKEKLAEYGSRVKLFPGVETWFERIRKYGTGKGVIVEHYIISSGLKEMIEGTSVAKKGAFEKIYASSFFYENGRVAKWPAQVVNYTNKTQFLFRIKKGVLDVNDPAVNGYFSPEKVRIPFSNMIYIGDSDTDVPCMKLVDSYGGYSIGVYNSDTEDKTKVHRMMREHRIKYFVPADYSKDGELDSLVKKIIDEVSVSSMIQEIHYKCEAETIKEELAIDKDERKKQDSFYMLENSTSFRRTHEIIAEMKKIPNWNDRDIERICRIVNDNNQVIAIVRDRDIRSFLSSLIQSYKGNKQIVSKIEELIETE